jgi:hypothetical protein
LQGQHDPSTVRRRFGGLLPDDSGRDICLHDVIVVAGSEWGGEIAKGERQSMSMTMIWDVKMMRMENAHSVDA